MGKLIDVKNAEQEKAFELHGNPDALYLSVKCSDNKHHYNPEKDNNPEIIFSDLTEEVGVYDQYPCEQDNEPDEEKLARLLKHLETIDKRYCDIVTMKLAGVEMDKIFEKLHLKSSRGYQVVDECEQACRKFFGLYCGKKKKKK